MSKIIDKLKTAKAESQIVNDSVYRTFLFAGISLAINLLYALWNLFLGFYGKSYWFITAGAYYTLLSVMRFAIVLFNKKNNEGDKSEIFTVRFSGLMLTALSIVLAGTVYMSVTFDVAKKLNDIVMISIATFTFAKITMSVINVFKSHKHGSPLLISLRNISLCDAGVSLLSMQRSMLATFDGMTELNIKIMNGVVGTVVYIFVCILGISMLFWKKDKQH